MADVAQLAEREVVALVSASSTLVVRPSMGDRLTGRMSGSEPDGCGSNPHLPVRVP